MLNLPVYLYTPAIRVFLDLENSTKQGVDKMYHGYLTIAKGLQNTIRFNFVNGDQRPINVHGMEFEFKLFDALTNNPVLSDTVTLTVQDDGATFALRGQTQLVLDPADTVNITPGNYIYSILRKNGTDLSPVFIDGANTMSGDVKITDGIVAKFIPSNELTFTKVTGVLGNPEYWWTGPVESCRDGRGNTALRSIQVNFPAGGFTGQLQVWASLANSPPTTLDSMALFDTIEFSNETGAMLIKFDDFPLQKAHQNVTYFAFRYLAPFAGTIDKILYRS